MAYRAAVQETTGQSPHKMMTGREMRLPADLLFGKPPDVERNSTGYVHELEENIAAVHQSARKKLLHAAERMKRYYDLSSNLFHLEEGSFVWFHNPRRRIGRCPKLQSDWDGPYRVMKVLTDVTIRIQRTPRSKAKIVHIDRLCPYSGNNAALWEVQAANRDD